jgi:hypothetical protein
MQGFLKFIGHVADIASVASFPLVIVPVLFYLIWTRWRGDIQKRYRITLIAIIGLGLLAYAVDIVDRFVLINPATRLRLHYVADRPDPEVLSQENVFTHYSFQFADDGTDSSDPRRTKWTILVIVFNKPLSSATPRARIFFEGPSLRHELRNATARSIQIRFDGSMGSRDVDIEMQS